MMTQQDFQQAMDAQASAIAQIREHATSLHASVRQTYDRVHPYGYHLDQVADAVRRFGHLVCADAADVLPLFFGAYYHDSIEDARLTYNDVLSTARRWMEGPQATMAAETVYALTNDKGRTRAERAGAPYYEGIRTTPYAPFVKAADRLANATYAARTAGETNGRMRAVYLSEMLHFLESIDARRADDLRYAVPQAMRDALLAVGTSQPQGASPAAEAQKLRVFVDMDNVLVDFSSGLVKVPEDVRQAYEGRYDEIPGIFGLMKPMDGAIEAMHALQDRYDLFILSTAPWLNPSAWADKVAWVRRYLDDVFHKRMVLTHRKDLCQGDYLIDDRGKNGTSAFGGEWIEFGSAKFPDWDSVVRYLGAEPLSPASADPAVG